LEVPLDIGTTGCLYDIDTGDNYVGYPATLCLVVGVSTKSHKRYKIKER
jgi:hypothetical protein